MNTRYKYITVFCGSKDPVDNYDDDIIRLANEIVDQGYGLVFGGGNVGLMKKIADAVRARHDNVIGITTTDIEKLDVTYKGITILTTPDLITRIDRMLEYSDGVIALPGGLGTLHEILHVAITNHFNNQKRTQKNIIKPLAIFNSKNFFEGLELHFNKSLFEGFMREEDYRMIKFGTDPKELVNYIANFKQPQVSDERWWKKKSSVAEVSIFSHSDEEATDEYENRMTYTP